MPQTQNSDQRTPPAHWQDDTLGRWEQAEFLTHFMASEYERLQGRSRSAEETGKQPVPRHFVMNIDSSWGFGKTFFLQRWKKDLEASQYLVLNFNAWESDYSKDPLLSFLSEIGTQLVQKLRTNAEEDGAAGAQSNAINWNTIRSKSAALLRNYGPSVARRAAIAGASTALFGMPVLWGKAEEDESDSETVSGAPDSFDGDTDANDKVAEKSVQKALEAIAAFETADLFEEENSRKRAITEFKDTLSAVVESVKHHQNAQNQYYKLPVFIFIDELDRCRPDFTIELIEIVKHIFSVNDVFFVFATDGHQLQASLAGMYGAQFDAEVYFKRIFSREMHLRRPNNRQFAKALIAEYGILDDPSSMNRFINVSARQNDLEAVVDDFEWVADVFDLTLRDQHQLAASFDSVFRFRTLRGEKTFTAITLALIVLWQKRKRLFKELMNRPEDFSTGANWNERLASDFPLYDQKASKSTTSFSADNGVEDITMSTALAAFASSLTLTVRDVGLRFRERGFHYGFESEICSAAYASQGGMAPNQTNRLLQYFDQVMMGG
ncbi:P-loop NTPase fold protein [Marinobacter sp.]|uniref:KAP family P-loop NTPase fold protein n=1 Tax=Marinobacter sp. TaxID=50741 RepID=UPI0035C72EC6